MATTQEHILISNIKSDIVILKDGGAVLVLGVSAVNFGLLSGREQMAIIFAFAQMLNSLSFSIQIFIYSERLNIDSYLKLLEKAQIAQKNPLLSDMIGKYKKFIQTTVRENEVLDKRFYLVIPLFALELGLKPTLTNLEQKFKTILLPRRDQIVRQLNRVGLKSTQLTKEELIHLFYDIYNGISVEAVQVTEKQEKIEVSLKEPTPKPTKPQQEFQPAQPSTPAGPPITSQVSRTHPFVVEELEENV